VFYLLREPFDDLFGDGGTTVLEFAQLRELAIQNSWIWPVTRRPARGRALRNAKQKHLRIVFPSSRATQPPKNNRHFFFFFLLRTSPRPVACYVARDHAGCWSDAARGPAGH
jgi:hypothetical protein